MTDPVSPVPILSSDGRSLTVRVPITLTRRSGRTLVIAPEAAAWSPPPKVDQTLVKALARAFRWRGLLEEGRYGTLDELARAEKINPSYVSRILRLTLLAPDIVEAILDGRQDEAIRIDVLLKPLPVEWERQRQMFGGEQPPPDHPDSRLKAVATGR